MVHSASAWESSPISASGKKGKVTVNGKPSDDAWGVELRSIEKQSGLIFLIPKKQTLWKK